MPLAHRQRDAKVLRSLEASVKEHMDKKTEEVKDHVSKKAEEVKEHVAPLLAMAEGRVPARRDGQTAAERRRETDQALLAMRALRDERKECAKEERLAKTRRVEVSSGSAGAAVCADVEAEQTAKDDAKEAEQTAKDATKDAAKKDKDAAKKAGRAAKDAAKKAERAAKDDAKKAERAAKEAAKEAAKKEKEEKLAAKRAQWVRWSRSTARSTQNCKRPAVTRDCLSQTSRTRTSALSTRARMARRTTPSTPARRWTRRCCAWVSRRFSSRTSSTP